MPLNPALRHASRVERDDLLVEAVKARRPFLTSCGSNSEVLSRGTSKLHLAALTAKGLRLSAVAGVAGVIARGIVLLVAEVVGKFSIESALDGSFR
jgi:hypothetical protein